MGPKMLTNEGLDGTLTVNYLGHFLLTNLLLREQMQRNNQPVKTINVVSGSYDENVMHFEDISYSERRYDIYKAYGESKLALMLFSMDLHKRYNHVTSIAVHPGKVTFVL